MKPFVCRMLLVVVPLVAGCTTFDLNLSDFGRPHEDQTAQVSEIVCLWETAEGVGLDGLPTRGFAGQVLFFAQGRAEPVRINGDVRIYLFDDQGTAEEQARPLHEFEFPADAWNTYLRNTNLGPAYQLFVPYTRKGGHFANCALRVRMTAPGRLPVYSKMATIALPGRRIAPAGSATAAADAAASARVAPVQDQSITEQAAIRKLSPQLASGERVKQLERLQRAAASTVQTADYVEAAAEPAGAAQHAEYETEAPLPRRYRMTPPDENPQNGMGS